MARFARIENDIVMEIIDAGDNDINKMFCPVIVSQLVEDPKNEAKENSTWDGSKFTDPEEFKADMIMVRMLRDLKLLNSDYTQGADSPLSDEKKAEWADYRQKLREFPEVVDLSNVVYPKEPSK
jgi:hypothetical protein